MVGQPDLGSTLRRDARTRQRVLLGQQHAHLQRPGQRAAIGGDQPHLDMRIGKVGIVFHVHDVRKRHQAAAQTDGRAVDGGHHRDAAACHAQHDLAAVQDRPRAQIGVLAQLLEVAEVAAGRERPARAGEHGRAGFPVLAQMRPHVRQAGV